MIGIFDSGIGGLTVFREVARRCPSLDILYLGDTARVPYGTKSPDTILRYSFEAAHFLGRHGIEMLVVACNTSSALALEALQADLAIPVLGVIHAGAKRAVAQSPGGRIGVIGTPATIKSGAYARAIKALRSDAEVTSAPCPLFVPLAEEGWTDNAVALETARIYLEPMRAAAIDTLVLGCTHYPVLKSVIGQVMGPAVTLVDSAEPIAEEIAARFSAKTGSGGTPGTRRYFVTDNWERFEQVGARFLGYPLERLEQVDVIGD